MAVMLKSSALSASSKGSKSSFYSGFGGKPNPVFQALEQELDAYKTFMQKRVGRRSKRPKDEAASIAYVLRYLTTLHIEGQQCDTVT